jgi:hypothetical protein
MPDDGRLIVLDDHPLASIFPLLSERELIELADDIAAKGLRDEIVLLDGKILDGRNRYRACLIAEVAPRFAPFSDGDPLDFVISRNLRRRHLDESQRAMVAARIATMRQGERTDLQPSADLPKVSQAGAAQMLSVSDRSVRNAAVVQRHGVPELGGAVERGEIAVSAAAEIARKPEPEQRELVKRPTAAAARKLARESGRGVVARDGKIYDGRSIEEERAAAAQTNVYFQVIEAIEALGTVEISPADYIASLPSHDGSGRYLDELIDKSFDAAAAWFLDFTRLWEAHRGSR